MKNNFTYFIPTRILFGKGELNNLHKQCLPGKKALIVITSGKSMKANGYLERVEEQLSKAGVEYALFNEVLPNPVLKNVIDGAQMCRQENCDFIVGLGGGSSIDCAKSIAIMASNPEGDYWEYVLEKDFPKNDPLPLVAITTTAGTGTEADPWTVVTNEETNEKIGYGYDKTYPVLSVVDPELMLTVPAKLTAYQGFDTLFHATESIINKNENPIGEIFALKAIELMSKYLPRAVKDGFDEEARENCALANTLAGFVMLCTSEHSLEHAMSGYHPELPHGAGLIMISLAYYKHFESIHACDDELVKMAKAMGVENAKEPADFINALHKLQIACGVDGLKMSDYGIEKSEFRALAKNAMTAMGGLFERDPARLSEDDCVSIFEESYK